MPAFRGILLALAILIAGNSCSIAHALTLPSGIVSIEEEAFAGNAAITELTVPEGAVSISGRAFAESGLKEITLPSTLTSIADDAFDGCDIEVAYAPWGSVAFEYCRAKDWYVKSPLSSALKIATYHGEAFKVVNTPVDPIYYAGLVRDRFCTHPGGTDKYSGRCMTFSYYYQYCMVNNVTKLNMSFALRKCQTSNKLNYAVEKYGDANTMLARLYDLLTKGVPQILMIRAGTRVYSRHFATVVGYRASVTRREDLRAKDLLIIDSYDGKLESMDPEVERGTARVLYKQEGKYRIETAWYRR